MFFEVRSYLTVANLRTDGDYFHKSKRKRKKKLYLPFNSFTTYLSAITTTFMRLTLDWMIRALGREITFWQRLRGADATCAIIRIPWHTLCTWIPTQPEGMSRDKSGILNFSVIYCSKLIIKPAYKGAVAVALSSTCLYQTELRSQLFHKPSPLSWPTCAWQQPLLGFINYSCSKYQHPINVVQLHQDILRNIWWVHPTAGTIECFVSVTTTQ